MPESARKLAVIIAFAIAMAAHVASAAPEFYTNLLRRGISEFNAGRYASAATLLRTAAFGLIDAVDQFETAQAYVAVASQRLGREEEARHAARRILMAERIQRRFAALPLPPELRTEFETLAKAYLTAAEFAALTDVNAAVPARPTTSTVQRRPTEQPTPSAGSQPPPRQPVASAPQKTAESKATPRAAEPAPSRPTEATQPPAAAAPPRTAEASPAPAAKAPAAAAQQPPATKPDAPTVREPDVVVETVEVAPPRKREETSESKPANLVEEAAEAAPTKPEPVKSPTSPVISAAPAERNENRPPASVAPTTPPKLDPPVKSNSPTPDQASSSQPGADSNPAAKQPAPQPTTDPRAENPPPPQGAQPEAPRETPSRSTEAPKRAEAPPARATQPATADPVREAQREFERKVVEVERQQAEAPARAVATRDVTKVLDDAGRAIDQNDLVAARSALRSVFANKELNRAAILRVAEEAYRARDFRLTVQAFERAGRLKAGEEPLGYYFAVALYETGRYAEAKAALREALPHIEVTDDVARYRVKIEGALD